MIPNSVGPAPLPAPQRLPHAFALDDITEVGAREHGEHRIRARFRSVPARFQATWILDQTAFDAFADWYEGTLGAGARAFDVRLAPAGVAGTRPTAYRSRWYVAQFVEPWRAVVQRVAAGLIYHVHAVLVTFGDGTAAGPGPGGSDTRVVLPIQAGGTIIFGGAVGGGTTSIAASGEITFGGAASLGAPPIAASGEITFDGGATSPNP